MLPGVGVAGFIALVLIFGTQSSDERRAAEVGATPYTAPPALAARVEAETQRDIAAVEEARKNGEVPAAIKEAERRAAETPRIPAGRTAALNTTLTLAGDRFVAAIDEDRSNDAEQLRALAAVGGITAKPLVVKIDATTRLLDGNGSLWTFADLRSRMRESGNTFTSVLLTWKLDHDVRTRADLEGAPAEEALVFER